MRIPINRILINTASEHRCIVLCLPHFKPDRRWITILKERKISLNGKKMATKHNDDHHRDGQSFRRYDDEMERWRGSAAQIKLFSFRRRSRQRYLDNYFSENSFGRWNFSRNIWKRISQLLIWVSFWVFACARYMWTLSQISVGVDKGGEWNMRPKCVYNVHTHSSSIRIG